MHGRDRSQSIWNSHRRRVPVLVIGLVLGLVLGLLPLRAAQAPDEVRAIWVLRTSLTSADIIRRMVRAAQAAGFNTLMVQVRGRGDAYFRSTLEPRPAGLAAQPSFDPLDTVLSAAHDAGLKVHAWVSVNLVSSATELPADRTHVIYRHPEWLMVPRQLVDEMAGLSPGSPEYLGKLARWTRTQSSDIEGLYVSPILPGAADHTVAVIADLAARYPIDGVHLDYARYPNDDFDYSAPALSAFRESVLPRLSGPERQRLDERAVIDRTIYADMFPAGWREFRLSRLNALVMKVRTTLRATRPGTILSAAVFPVAEVSRQRLQDWQTWLDHDLIDILCPMAYTPDATIFRQQVQAARELAGLHPVWVGIGAYRLSSAQTIENILAARSLGANGIILFSYDSLTSPPNGSEYLSEVARAAFEQ